MTKTVLKWLPAGLAAAGLFLIAAWLYRPVQIIVNDQSQVVRALALSPGVVLREAGLALRPGDRVDPAPGTFLPGLDRIQIRSARSVQVWDGTRLVSLETSERIPANILMALGIRLFPGDLVLFAGQALTAGETLPDGTAAVLQVRPAQKITLQTGGETQVLFSSASTLGLALWEAGILLNPADRLEPPASTPLTGSLQAHLSRARPLNILTQTGAVHLVSAARTVGAALADAGLSLQGLDYTLPAEDQPIPASGQFRLVRVRETILLQQKQIAFKSTTAPDPNTELDQTSVITPGVTGLQVTRIRIRAEDGKEIGRQTESVWTARQPKNQVLGYGTKVVISKEVVNGVTIEYWRKITAYATSYSACDAGACGRPTASGAPAARGIIAVIPSWYYAMKGQQVYIPGYGQATIGDIGGGIPGTNWVDLAFSESDYTSWHSNVTVYFLTPVPANILWVLP